MFALRTKSWALFWLLAAIAGSPAGYVAYANVMMRTPVKMITENRLEAFFAFLQDYKAFCGHYPLNVDEYERLFRATKMRDLAPCPKFSEVMKRYNKRKGEGVMRLQDGWREPMTYSSDGKTFRLEASHGYSITEQTTAKKNGLHWDNPTPPPDDPPPSNEPEPGMEGQRPGPSKPTR